MVDGFEVVTKRFAADRNAVFDHFRRLASRKLVSLDRIGCVGQLDVEETLKTREGFGRERP